jgi:hypothetical protein
MFVEDSGRATRDGTERVERVFGPDDANEFQRLRQVGVFVEAEMEAEIAASDILGGVAGQGGADVFV